ncbi:MAG: sulfatase [Acidobacteriota bacterium]
MLRRLSTLLMLATLAGPAAAEKPSLLLISVDTLRADALSSYGYPHPISPTLDALAAQGVLFEDAQTVIGKTGPAFATVFSSLYPPTHGARRNGVRMREDVPVLAELLSAEGYATAAFISNWTLRTNLAAVHRGFDVFDETFDRKRYGVTGAERSAEAIVKASLAWIAEQRATEPDQPVFLWVHFSEPHNPYVLHEEFAPPKPPESERTEGWQKRWRYASEVGFTDHWIAKFLEDLEPHLSSNGRLNVFLSDHGESLGEHGYWGHGKNTHWANLRVPLFFWGDGVPRGQRLASPASLVDVAPTLLELLSLEAPESFTGRSLKGAWTGDFDEARHRYSFGDRHTAIRVKSRSTFKNPLEIALETSGTKVIFSFEKRQARFYDIAGDPSENRPLQESPIEARPPLARQLANWYRGLEKFESRSGVLSDEDREKLEALGYIGAP